jgi:hypothetical protein
MVVVPSCCGASPAPPGGEGTTALNSLNQLNLRHPLHAYTTKLKPSEILFAIILDGSYNARNYRLGNSLFILET